MHHRAPLWRGERHGMRWDALLWHGERHGMHWDALLWRGTRPRHFHDWPPRHLHRCTVLLLLP